MCIFSTFVRIPKYPSSREHTPRRTAKSNSINEASLGLFFSMEMKTHLEVSPPLKCQHSLQNFLDICMIYSKYLATIISSCVKIAE